MAIQRMVQEKDGRFCKDYAAQVAFYVEEFVVYSYGFDAFLTNRCKFI